MATRRRNSAGEAPRGKTVVQPRKEELRRRLRRIAGQVAGIQTMIEEDRYCVEILTQISACRSALDSVAGLMLEDHTRHCVLGAQKPGQSEELIRELVETFQKYR